MKAGLASIEKFTEEIAPELERILQYWTTYAIDQKQGGFYGKIDHHDLVYPEAPKGSVLNSRILWSFSAAGHLSGNKYYKQVAERAYHYIVEHFIDHEYGGVYWTVGHTGKPLNDKKQTYALAFALYGISEYYKLTQEEAVLQQAIALYKDIILHTGDQQYGGYHEAFSRTWTEIKDLRLSAKDSNEKKSMNTHLHVVEAFANLYSTWPDAALKERIQELLMIFSKYIIDPVTHHQALFFGEDWSVRSETISYGHDIEAAWLLQECAEIIADESYIRLFRSLALDITKAAEEGLDSDGGLWYEYEPSGNKLVKEKHWWPQAEALVGFFNAWQISGDAHFMSRAKQSWAFIKTFMSDNNSGEWVWGVHEDYSVMDKEDKIGLWKCPYHNSRACIELIKRSKQYLR